MPVEAAGVAVDGAAPGDLVGALDFEIRRHRRQRRDAGGAEPKPRAAPMRLGAPDPVRRDGRAAEQGRGRLKQAQRQPMSGV